MQPRTSLALASFVGLRIGCGEGAGPGGGFPSDETARRVHERMEADRPEFVKEGCPEDRAYRFQPGDLRGVYSVFLPEDSIGDAPSGAPADHR